MIILPRVYNILEYALKVFYLKESNIILPLKKQYYLQLLSIELLLLHIFQKYFLDSALRCTQS